MNSQLAFNTIKAHVRTSDTIEDRLLVLASLEAVAMQLGLEIDATEARQLNALLRSCDERQVRFLYGEGAK